MHVVEMRAPGLITIIASLLTVAPMQAASNTFVSNRNAWLSRISRGGASNSNYAAQCEAVKSFILAKYQKEIDSMRKQIVEEGAVLTSLGNKADTICNQALEEFAQSAPDPTASDESQDSAAGNSLVYDKKLEELEAALDTPLQLLYVKQLSLLRDKALQAYRLATRASDSSDYEAMLAADSQFVRDAEDSTRKEGADWDYSLERTHLQSVMNDIASSRKKLTELQMKNAEKQSTAMAFLQQQQQMIQQLQMQLYGQSSPWNIGLAYRIPDTNFNVQGTYQQGRANVQLSCVPDEYAPMLGPNGFTNGVGPGNLGLSLNLSI